MADNKKIGKEEKIIVAAEKLFIENGYSGTSTYDIAKEAGCNHALIHYYFRTKDNLFRKVFEKKIGAMMAMIDESIAYTDIKSALRFFLDRYFEFLESNPKIPLFIMNELLTRSERLSQFKKLFQENKERQVVYENFCFLLEKAVKEGKIREVSPNDLIIDIISNTAFSFIIAPVYLEITNNTETHHEFLMRRKEEVYTLLVQGLVR